MLRKDQLPILAVNILGLIFFSGIFILQKNYEFLLYIIVFVLIILFVIFTNERAQYSNALSWGLSIWGFMHLTGSGIYVDGVKLYEIILIPISSYYQIFRYDQLVHVLGMAIMTIAVYDLLKSYLTTESIKNWGTLAIFLVAISLGVGAWNEIVEFFVTVLIPRNGVGGYLNTSLDQVSNLAGIFIALVYIRTKNFLAEEN